MLRLETSQLVKDTDECEEQERKLMEDIVHQLHSANSEYEGISEYYFCVWLGDFVPKTN